MNWDALYFITGTAYGWGEMTVGANSSNGQIMGTYPEFFDAMGINLVDGLQARREVPQIEFIVGDPEPEFDGAALVFRHLQPLGEAQRERLREERKYAEQSLHPLYSQVLTRYADGELRRVPGVERRLAEAARLGYKQAIVPAGSEAKVAGMRVKEVATLGQAIALVDA